MEDHLLADGQAAPAMLGRPADAGPAPFGELALPGLALFGKAVFVTRAAAKAQGLELTTEVFRQPAGDFEAEGFVRLTETDLHAISPRRAAAMRSRCQDGAPNRASLARARLK
ncbi:hypothetical protein D9M68_800870 [compost metagenome]